jgi:cell division protein FtsB
MSIAKRYIIRIVLGIEIIVFLSIYLFGPQGIWTFQKLAEENKVVEHAIQGVKAEIAGLDKQITACKSDAFYKERIAREQLQMARKDDVIYYLDCH